MDPTSTFHATRENYFEKFERAATAGPEMVGLRKKQIVRYKEINPAVVTDIKNYLVDNIEFSNRYSIFNYSFESSYNKAVVDIIRDRAYFLTLSVNYLFRDRGVPEVAAMTLDFVLALLRKISFISSDELQEKIWKQFPDKKLDKKTVFMEFFKPMESENSFPVKSIEQQSGKKSCKMPCVIQ